MTAKDFLLYFDNSDKSVVEILDLYAKEKAFLAFDAGYKFGLGIGVGSTVPSEYLPDNKKTFLKLHFPNQ